MLYRVSKVSKVTNNNLNKLCYVSTKYVVLKQTKTYSRQDKLNQPTYFNNCKLQSSYKRDYKEKMLATIHNTKITSYVQFLCILCQ